jgi:hypothetical protein
MWKRVLSAVALTMLLGNSAPAAAQDEGLAGLHAKVRIGNRICMADHFHTGTSTGHASRKQAASAAIADWAGFTAWEYGSHWGNFAMAESKRISCSQPTDWSCVVEARPCRRR